MEAKNNNVLRVFIPNDSVTLALGGDEIAAALEEKSQQAGISLEVIRNSTRALFWLEPLIEVETSKGRIGYGPVSIDDIDSLITAGAFSFDATEVTHPLALGLVDNIPYLARQKRRLFARLGVNEALSIADYENSGGWAGLKAALNSTSDGILSELKASGLRGRGGAAFPTAIKWQTVAAAQSEDKYIVCNADEGDSGSFADRLVMEADPYMLIEGMTIAGITVGSKQGYIYIRSEYPQAIDMMCRAIELARINGFLGDNICGSGRTFNLEVRKAAGSYVCGEETALLESLEGKRGIVRAKPPIPALDGLFGKPTVINNVLTYASVPLILAEGGQKYADDGVGRSLGTMPFQLAGNIKYGGLVELPFGITLRELMFDFGGGSISGLAIKAAQVGGPLGTYVPETLWDVPMEYEAYAKEGAVLGHGSVVVHDESADMPGLARYAMEFCALESCGKCTPCRIGSTRGVEVIDRMMANEKRDEQVVLLRDLCEVMVDGSLCAMGGMTPFPVRSAVKFFPKEFGLSAKQVEDF